MDKTGLVRILTIRDGTPYKRYEQLIRYDAPNRTLVYQLIDNQRVTGSSPVAPTN